VLLKVDRGQGEKVFRADDGTLIGTTFFGGPPNNVFMTNWFDKKLEKPTRLENYLILKTL
jgi:hypothetical protein